ncbi:hypothetical protein V8C35DRAFT_23470 [Trichoderma chlorosporum]
MCMLTSRYSSARAEKVPSLSNSRGRYAAGEACEVADMQLLYDWVHTSRLSVSSSRRPSHTMQAMQRHPQRTRGPETDMSFDSKTAVRWTLCLGCRQMPVKAPSNSVNTPPRSEMHPIAQPTETAGGDHHLSTPWQRMPRGYQVSAEGLLRQSIVAISFAVPDTANTRSPPDPTNGAVPSAAMPPERDPFPPF